MAQYQWSEGGERIIIIGPRLAGPHRAELAHRIGPDEDAVMDISREELVAWLKVNPRPQR